MPFYTNNTVYPFLCYKYPYTTYTLLPFQNCLYLLPTAPKNLHPLHLHQVSWTLATSICLSANASTSSPDLPALTHAHTHPFNGPFSGLPRWAGTRKVKPIWFYWSKRHWVAVASAGPCASLHLAPDRQPRQHPTTQFFYRPDALPAAQPTASKHWRHNYLHWLDQ